jgi:hypothetical protein
MCNLTGRKSEIRNEYIANSSVILQIRILSPWILGFVLRGISVHMLDDFGHD